MILLDTDVAVDIPRGHPPAFSVTQPRQDTQG